MTEPHQDKLLNTRLKAVWRRGQVLHRTAGLLAFFRWGLLLFLIGMAVDWLLGLPASGRVVILAALLAVAFYKAWCCGWRHLRRFNASRTALQVESRFSGLESLLISAVQFRESAAGPSTAMRDLTIRKAGEAVAPMRSDQVVSYAGLRRPLWLMLALVALLAGFGLYNGPFLAAGLARIFQPWLAVDYPTRTQLLVENGDMVVQEGSPALIRARVSGVIPKQASLTLRTGKGKPRERTLAVRDGTCEYDIETVFRSFDYRISAGDAQSAWHSVRVISSPRIERAEVSLEFPEYTRRPAETVEALTLTVPEGTRIRWKLALDRAVSEAEFRPAGGAVQPLAISPDGCSVTMEQVATESRGYSFGWVDKKHGFRFYSPLHYLQVAPDQTPGVELTSPGGNLYATLQRNLDFAFRGRDDHGIGEAVIAYRFNKAGEVKVALPAPELSDGSEQRIDWDYRAALPDLAVGDTVSFAIELADRYPGPQGPHRVRSGGRRVQFLSKEDYLAQIEKEKRRLLAQVRTIYREERGIHDLVRNLNPAADIFLQTCQLEAVRQDLIRERLGAVRKGINTLVEDLAANKIAEEAESGAMVKLGTDLQTIADAHVGRAASLLRDLATVTDGGVDTRNPAAAVAMVDSSARELGLVVLQLGFAEAADVMARELHATTQTQAALRLQTIIRGEADAAGDGDLAKEQTRLAKETARLLAATPRNKESTSTDALVAFNLSRMVNELLRSGADAKMQEAAALISKAGSEKAARLQAEVIASLLGAEFRLRRGSEYEALTNARDLFAAQAAGQRTLREEGADMSAEKLAQSQAAHLRELHLLLMPEVPAPRPKLHDVIAPSAPPVDDLLTAAEHAMQAALTQIEAGDREAAAGHHQQAQTAFEKLAEIAGWRMEAMTERARMKAAVINSGKQAAQLLTFEERLLALLEQTEDAADDDEAKSVFLAALNQALADDAESFLGNIVRWKEAQTNSSEDDLSLIDCLSRVARAVGKATPLLKENKPGDAVKFQEQALDALKEAAGLNEELTETRTAIADVLSMAESALAPSPLLAEIEAEQGHLSALTEKAKLEDRPSLVIPQKNLIHAVDAVVASLDPLAHKIESGTVMIFAKDDMDAAAIGLETDDIEEALDAQSAIMESLQELRAKIDDVTPQYRYVLEVTENLYETVPQGARIRTGTRQLLEKAEGAPDAAAVKTQVKQFGEQLQKLTGEEGYVATARQLENAIGSGAAGAGAEDALDALVADTEALQLLMDNLAYLIAPPLDLGSIPVPTPEIKLLEDVLGLAAHHKDLSRKTQTAGQEQLAELAEQQRKLADQCEALFPPPAPARPPTVEPPSEEAEAPELVDPFEAADPEPVIEPEPVPAPTPPAPTPVPAPPQPAPKPHPNLAAAHRHLSEAAARLQSGDRDAAITRQTEAGDALRHFIIEYALKYVMIPPPGPPLPPAPPIDTDEFEEQAILPLFEPGALTGDKPKGGRLEWEVLGRRDRAALNENFARELPLEYRAILKDYYERLTE
jgi:hypothetical protein